MCSLRCHKRSLNAMNDWKKKIFFSEPNVVLSILL